MAGLLTLEESAQRLGVAVEEVLRLVERRELFPLRDGPTLKFKADDLERYSRSIQDDDGLDLELSGPGASGSSASVKTPRLGTLADSQGGDIDFQDSRAVSDSAESIFADSNPASASSGDRGFKLALDEVEGTAIFGSTPGGSAQPQNSVDDVPRQPSKGKSKGVSSHVPSSPGGTFGEELDLDGSLIEELSLAPEANESLEISGISPAAGSNPSGQPAATGISDVTGLSMAGESGISLDDADIESSGILLSAVGVGLDEDVLSGMNLGDEEPASSSIDLDNPTSLDEDSVSLEAFDPVLADGDDNTASGIFAASSGDSSSIFGDSIAPDASSFGGDIAAVPQADAIDFELSGMGNAFGALQVDGLVCCTLLL
ncbi:MAG: helix-turn-helix domain-containing protein, partial [Planctomycetaceae bacterium]